MLVWLVDFDGKIPNLALMRLAAWHKQRGDTVTLKCRFAGPELFECPERVYVSCLFRWNRARALELAQVWGDRAMVGGTGVNLTTMLPQQVEDCEPDYTLYGVDYALGFISRGCPNRCPWCVVPQKEGGLRRVAMAQQIVGGRHQAVFLDNNFLALADHCDDLRWLAEKQVGVDFNQGLDAQYITEENARLLAACRWLTPGHQTVRLALDSVGRIPVVDRALTLLDAAGLPPYRVSVYVLIGFEGFESDVERLLHLRGQGATVFPMGYRDLDTGSEPARGWDRRLYLKYRRLLCRVPHANQVWEDFKTEAQEMMLH